MGVCISCKNCKGITKNGEYICKDNVIVKPDANYCSEYEEDETEDKEDE